MACLIIWLMGWQSDVYGFGLWPVTDAVLIAVIISIAYGRK